MNESANSGNIYHSNAPLSGGTKGDLYGLIGYPLSHSFSPAHFEKKFRDEKIKNTRYLAFPLQHIRDMLDLLKLHPELQGLNVTIPHKETIIPFLHELDETAKKTGAVNTVKIERKGAEFHLTGYNTDTYGFKKALSPLLLPHHKKALILGTGGGAKAVAQVLSQFDINAVMVSRRPIKNVLSYETLDGNILSSHHLIINATPLGMHPFVYEFPPVPYQYLSEKHLLFDLIYNPAETTFMKKGKIAGAAVSNGLTMLEYQAEKSWEIWNANR